MTNFAPGKWRYEEALDRYRVYEFDTEIALVRNEQNARLIANAPELYWMAYNLLFELKQGNGANPEYVKQAIPQIEDLLNRIEGLTEELKRCPFCGGYAGIYRVSDHSHITWRVQCNHCMCGTTTFALPFMAVDKWNRRELS